MRIAAVGSAFPSHLVPQADVLRVLERAWAAHPTIARRAEAIYASVGVETRHFVRPVDEYERSRTFRESNDLWIEHAVPLAEAASRAALDRAGLEPADVDVILFTTVTGLATPSVDARLVNRMGLRSDVKRLPLFGLGCVAGAAGLARAAEQVGPGRARVALLVSVELCTLTVQIEDVSMANLIATALFGDGATAVVVVDDEDAGSGSRGPSVVGSRSTLYPHTERAMGWDVSERGFHLVLSPEVPDVVRRHAGRDADALLSGAGLLRRDVARWIVHPGGPKILEALEESLALRPGDADGTWASLRSVGNLSSSSVLHVLEAALHHSPRPAPGSHGVVAAMGPGFCSEMVLIRWD